MPVWQQKCSIQRYQCLKVPARHSLSALHGPSTCQMFIDEEGKPAQASEFMTYMQRIHPKGLADLACKDGNDLARCIRPWIPKFKASINPVVKHLMVQFATCDKK